MNYLEIHSQSKENSIAGRYITLHDIEPIIKKYNPEIIGKSVLGKPIYQIKLGSGATKIFMWSQMHGNESTTTKALFDFINLLQSGSEIGTELLSKFTFCMIPMLNPDGAEAYTRVNANQVDLNRDSQDLTQPESMVLRQTFEAFKPHYCYNLHDQRTIFGAGEMGNPATVSFLSPSYNENRDINEVRKKAMAVIVAMNQTLQEYIPGKVGRFDDSFNINCIGDTFQSLNVPTILFEAGHYPEDYQREETRKYIFIAMLSGFLNLINSDNNDDCVDEYLNIPQNKIVFFDMIYKNVTISKDDKEKILNFAAQYTEILVDGSVVFEARIAKIGDLENNFGHYEFDAQGKPFFDGEKNFPVLDSKADFKLGKSMNFVNGLLNL